MSGALGTCADCGAPSNGFHRCFVCHEMARRVAGGIPDDIRAAIHRAAARSVRACIRRRARSMLAHRGQLEMIATGLSYMPAALMVRRVRELRAVYVPYPGSTEGLNLPAAELAARVLRRSQSRLRARVLEAVA